MMHDMGPNVIFPTLLPHTQQQPVPLTPGQMDLWNHDVYTKFSACHQHVATESGIC